MSTPPSRYDEYGFEITAKPPRPQAKIGALLLILGGAAQIIGVFVPWYQGTGIQTLRGLDIFAGANGDSDLPKPGIYWIAVGVVLIALGAVTYLAGRFRGVAIAGALIAILEVPVAGLGWGAVNNENHAGGTGEAGAGVIIGTIAALVAIAGAIQVLSKRRR